MPASGRFLLDMNIVIALLDGEKAVLSRLEDASEIFISATAVGELFFGAAKSGRPAENWAKLEAFVAGRSILSCDLQVAREYGRIKKSLRDKGRPIPENDIWMAATAKCYGLTFVSRDPQFREA